MRFSTALTRSGGILQGWRLKLCTLVGLSGGFVFHIAPSHYTTEHSLLSLSELLDLACGSDGMTFMSCCRFFIQIRVQMFRSFHAHCRAHISVDWKPRTGLCELTQRGRWSAMRTPLSWPFVTTVARPLLSQQCIQKLTTITIFAGLLLWHFRLMAQGRATLTTSGESSVAAPSFACAASHDGGISCWASPGAWSAEESSLPEKPSPALKLPFLLVLCALAAGIARSCPSPFLSVTTAIKAAEKLATMAGSWGWRRSNAAHEAGRWWQQSNSGNAAPFGGGGDGNSSSVATEPDRS